MFYRPPQLTFPFDRPHRPFRNLEGELSEAFSPVVRSGGTSWSARVEQLKTPWLDPMRLEVRPSSRLQQVSDRYSICLKALVDHGPGD